MDNSSILLTLKIFIPIKKTLALVALINYNYIIRNQKEVI